MRHSDFDHLHKLTKSSTTEDRARQGMGVLFTSGRIPFVRISKSGELLSANEAWYSLTGGTAGADIGRTLTEQFGSRSSWNLGVLINELRQHGMVTAHPLSLQLDSGEIREVVVDACSLNDSLEPEFGLVFHDVTTGSADQTTESLFDRLAQTGIIDASEDMVYFRSLDGRVEMLNSARSRISGYTSDEIAAGELLPRNCFHPDDLRLLDALVRDNPKGSPRHEIIYRIRTRTGRWRHIQSRLVGVKGSSGRYEGYFCIDRDISEAIESRKSAEETEELFRTIFMASPDSVTISRIDDSMLVEVNPSFEKISGYSREECLGNTALALGIWAVPSERDQIIGQLQMFGSFANVEAHIRRKDKAVISCLVSGRPIVWKGENHLLLIARDITDLKRQQAELEESRIRLQSLFDHALDAILLFDNEGRCIDINPTACGYFGASRPEILRKSFESLLVCPKGCMPGELWSKVMTSDSAQHEFLLKKLDGSERVVEAMWVKNVQPNVHFAVMRDVTENRRHQDSLQRSEERFRLVADLTQDLEYWIGPDGQYVYVSPAAAEITGYAASQFVADVSLMQRIVHPEDREAFRKHIQSAEESSNAHSMDFRLLRSDGSLVWVNHTVRRAIGGDGRNLGLRASARDITSRKRIERELMRREREFRALFTEMVDGFSLHEIICDETGKPVDYRFMDVNPAFARLTGLKAEEAIGRTVRDLLPDIEPFWIETYGEVALKGSTCHFTSFSRDLDAYYEVTAYCPEPGQFAVIFSDATERKRAERLLLESESRFRNIAELLPEGIFEADRDGRISFMNRRAADYFECNPANADAERRVHEFVSPEARTEFDSRWQAVLVESRSASFDVAGRSAAGHNLEMNLNLGPMEEKGAVVGVRGVVRDIAQMKRIEDELRRAQKLESVGVLAGGIAHDFNNLLTGILGNIGLVVEDDGISNESRTRLIEAERATMRATTLTKQLLTFARGGEPVRRLAALPKLIVDTVEFPLRGSSVKASFEIAPDLPPALIDEGQIGQVLHNLSLNALQAMPAGGIIWVRAEIAHVGRNSSLPLPTGRYIRIEVEDEGIGIAPENLGKVFDPYFTTKETGSGLGLATSYAIISKHDGLIEVESHVEQGTTFRFYLPAAEGTVAESTNDSTADLRGSGSVLVMDDEEYIRELTVKILTKNGYAVETAGDGVEAISRLQQARAEGKSFAVAVLDLTIPGGMGGIETLAALRNMDPAIRAVVCSGYSNDPVMANFRDYGFDAVVSKPFRMADFLAAVARARDAQPASVPAADS